MVDSGYRMTEGSSRDFLRDYSRLIDQARSREPEVEITAFHEPAGISGYRVFGTIKNVSDGKIFGWDNSATINVLVWEEKAVLHTGRFVHQASYMDFEDDLGPGETYEFSTQVPDVLGASMENLNLVVIVDYRPGGDTGIFESAQAAIVEEYVPVTPTDVPTAAPTEPPTAIPTSAPTEAPTEEPTPTTVPVWKTYLPSTSNGEEG